MAVHRHLSLVAQVHDLRDVLGGHPGQGVQEAVGQRGRVGVRGDDLATAGQRGVAQLPQPPEYPSLLGRTLDRVAEQVLGQRLGLLEDHQVEILDALVGRVLAVRAKGYAEHGVERHDDSVRCDVAAQIVVAVEVEPTGELAGQHLPMRHRHHTPLALGQQRELVRLADPRRPLGEVDGGVEGPRVHVTAAGEGGERLARAVFVQPTRWHDADVRPMESHLRGRLAARGAALDVCPPGVDSPDERRGIIIVMPRASTGSGLARLQRLRDLPDAGHLA